jgi:hypothetical protein
MERPRHVCVVGAGSVGRSVLAELPNEWLVTMVDRDTAALAGLPARPGRRDLAGDATSRLVLVEAGLTPTSTLVLTTRSDEVNREAARIAVDQLGVEEVVLVQEVAGPPCPGTTVVTRAPLIAAKLLNAIGVGDKRGVSLGLGQGELREVNVLVGSPAVGRPLRELRARNWLVAAVYRGGQLVIPHGDTAVLPGDQVLLVGEPGELSGIAAWFRGGAPTFPASYGARLGCVGPRTLEQGARLAERLSVRDVVELPPFLLDPGITPPERLAQALDAASVGCLLVEPRAVPWPARAGFTTTWWSHQLLAARVPVLLVRGAGEPRRILLALGPEHDSRVIGGAAIDLAKQLGAPLEVLTVLPALISPDAEAATDPSRDFVVYARLHGVEPARTVVRGNPVERIRAHARPDDLLVIGHSRVRRNTLFRPDVSTFLVHDAPAATLLMPWARRSGGAPGLP